jgi:hypothetical protein
MIDWDSEDWGGRIHLAANGSWVPDRHGDEVDEEPWGVVRRPAATRSVQRRGPEDR